jgi:hypothetical protein
MLEQGLLVAMELPIIAQYSVEDELTYVRSGPCSYKTPQAAPSNCASFLYTLHRVCERTLLLLDKLDSASERVH